METSQYAKLLSQLSEQQLYGEWESLCKVGPLDSVKLNQLKEENLRECEREFLRRKNRKQSL
jgi:hypothetical protein